MASSGNIINYNNFSHTIITTNSKTIYNYPYYWYVRSESWGFKCKSNSQIFGDWHGYIRFSRYDGSGWTEVYKHYVQDTSANWQISFRHNLRGDITEPTESDVSRYANQSSKHNLWRVFADWERGGDVNGLTCTFYIGSPGTMLEYDYNAYLKSYPELIYSNGRISKSGYEAAVLSGGGSGFDIDTVLSYFNSNTGTLIYGSYEKSIVGPLYYS